MPKKPYDTTYPISLEVYGQTLGEMTEKMIGPAILIFPALMKTKIFSEETAIPIALLISLIFFGTATALTQFTLIYTKSKREDNVEEINDTSVIRFLTKHPIFTSSITNIAALAEGLTASAAIIRFGLKMKTYTLERYLGNVINTLLITLSAIFICYSRYKKINYVDSQEARNEYEKRRQEKLLNPLDLMYQKKFPFKKRVKMIDPHLTNYLSYQISPNLENALNILGPSMLYADIAECMPHSFRTTLFIFCVFAMLMSSFGEYSSQLQDSQWYRDNAYLSYKKKQVDQWKHEPYWLGKIIFEITKLPGRIALFFPRTDPTKWIYNGIKISKVTGYICLMGAAPFELYKVVQGEIAHPSMLVGIFLALFGMTIGFFAGRGQCHARDTGLRNISAYLAYTLGVKETNLFVPKPENYFQWPGLWGTPPGKGYARNLRNKANIANKTYRLS